MSFRSRLTLFFVLIVIVPMVSVAFVLFRLIADNESGKADAGVKARQETAISLFDGAQAVAGRRLREIGADKELARALQAGDQGRVRVRAADLLAELRVRRMAITDGGRTVVDIGQRD